MMNMREVMSGRQTMNRWMIAAGAAAALVAGGASVQAEAKVGKPAPAFSATDTEDRTRSLDEFKGQFVVLEWFNDECPFVRKHYDSSNMQRLQTEWTERGVVWLTVASSAPGKQGYRTPEQARAIVMKREAAPTALLLDPDGTVGKRYGAKTTPHLFIINPEGRVIYAGAIDDRPSPDPADLQGATNYVNQALQEATAGQPVSVAETQSYGCSVKY
jgi:peroxiredoxin